VVHRLGAWTIAVLAVGLLVVLGLAWVIETRGAGGGWRRRMG